MYDYKAIRRVDPNLFQSMNLPAVVTGNLALLCVLHLKRPCMPCDANVGYLALHDYNILHQCRAD